MLSPASHHLDRPLVRHGVCLVFLSVSVILANCIALSGVFNDDPEFFISGLGTEYYRGIWLGRANWYDPTIGFVVQALGHACAQDWLHGVIPWWNPYSGVGMPQAAELQNYALFLPFVLLLHFHSGWLWLRVILQIMSAAFTYALAVQIGLTRFAAVIAGLLYACMGSVILIAHAPVATFVFLPLLLIGIEHAAAAASSSKPMGWALVTLALAYSFYAGFPETAFMADLFGAVWLLYRLIGMPGPACARLIAKLAMASALAVGLMLPGLVPFVEYLRLGTLGDHSAVYAAMHLPLTGLAIQFLPLVFGPLGSIPIKANLAATDAVSQSVYLAWGNSGGWIGALPLMLAICGMLTQNKKMRGLKWMLFAWFAFWQLRIFGVPMIVQILNLVPGLRLIDFTRFAEPSCDFAIIFLAAMTLDDWRRSLGLAPKRLMIAAAITFGILLVAIVPALPILAILKRDFAIFGLIAREYIVSVAILLLGVLALLQRQPRGFIRFLIIAVVAGSTIAGFALSQLAGARSGRIDHSGTQFITAHIGLSRVFSLGPLAPNYGAEYRIAEIDYNMLPIPKLWTDYITANLDHRADPIVFNGQYERRSPKVPDAAAELRANLPHYEAIGVKYILVAPDQDPFAPLNAAAPPLIYQNDVMKIYQLANPAPYFSVTNSACRLKVRDREFLDTFCTAPATLVRQEQYYPGWQASVNGLKQAVSKAGVIFQSIQLPKGTSTVTFLYRPTHELLACRIALGSIVVWLYLWWLSRFGPRAFRRSGWL